MFKVIHRLFTGYPQISALEERILVLEQAYRHQRNETNAVKEAVESCEARLHKLRGQVFGGLNRGQERPAARQMQGADAQSEKDRLRRRVGIVAGRPYAHREVEINEEDDN
jgi:hypothetical protein